MVLLLPPLAGLRLAVMAVRISCFLFSVRGAIYVLSLFLLARGNRYSG